MTAAAAVLFDMDGLLVDSEPLWTVAEEALAERITGWPGSWSHELKASIIGTRIDVAVPAILRWYGAPAGPGDVEAAQQFLLEEMARLFSGHVPWRPGAVELVEALQDREVTIGLVSSSYRILVDAVLEQLPAGTFALSLAGDEVLRGKPDPEPYLTACERLGVTPAEVVVLEDAPSGVAAAEAAGCVCVGVPSVAALEPLPRRPVVESLAAVDPDWLLSLPELSRS